MAGYGLGRVCGVDSGEVGVGEVGEVVDEEEGSTAGTELDTGKQSLGQPGTSMHHARSVGGSSFLFTW